MPRLRIVTPLFFIGSLIEMVCFKEFLRACVAFCVAYNVAAAPKRLIPSEDDKDPWVETKVGKIRGLRAEDGDYSMFMGIPYAELDADNIFGAALPYSHFDSIFDAFDDSSICPQIEEFNLTIVGHKDCLNLNVYVPNSASPNNKLPVLVWIFGGGLSTGFAGRFLYGPRYLVRHDIVLVTFNYRLGPYGFMCLDTPEVPGNQGLKDQVIALRWIKENIQAFGGDNNRITLAGNSAGAMLVDIHLHFGREENLFQKIILQSGVSLIAGTITSANPTAPLLLAEYFNHTSNDLADALSFLSTLESDQVIAAVNKIGLNFGLCIEKQFDGVENFITQSPIQMEISRIKDVEVLIGFNKNELLARLYSLPDTDFDHKDFVRNSIDSYFDFEGDEELYDEMHEMVSHFYFGDEKININFKQRIIDLSSDFNFNHPILRSVKKYLDNGADTLYMYLFSYAGGRNFLKNRLHVKGRGATHADELGYLFDISYMKKPLTPEDQLIVDRITLLWANFIKYGNPTPRRTELVPLQWPAVTPDRWHFLELDSELRVSTRPFHDRMAFLDLFYKTNEQYRIGYKRETEKPESSSRRNIVIFISLPLLCVIKYYF